MAFCSPCNRTFKNDAALSMHLRDSKAHDLDPDPATITEEEEEDVWKCTRCETEFDSQEGLTMHALSSEKHFACMACLEDGQWEDFLTKRALKSHIWGKHKHDSGEQSKKKDTKGKVEVRETPLDGFFTSFVGFAYDPHVSPEASWKKLRRFQGWKGLPPDGRRGEEENDAWGRYQGALVREVEMWFGDEKDLTAWRTLCKAVGEVDPPDEIRECKKILRTTHVNIVDLIDWGRKGGDENEGKKVKVFKSVEELAHYSVRRKKIFRKEQWKEYRGGNVVLKHLLRVFFTKGRQLVYMR
ncbi:C2H2-type domain-containing protein [Trichoderma simmonsii]|uniref:C2H2-type domain-containing protein n=1 Tax=Trichoderma simmonsii TaxID=1491479 RepID=A0A8G0LPL1_9HYPO|nr:C2H2-type domain-containing protein [Trichoderma simmonsii]